MTTPQPRTQRGQTIAIVAISMVSLLAVAALAIDLTTLYVARGEIQRAADSAALAGAKAFVDSGVTTDPANSGLQTVAQSLASSYAVAAALQNNVAGASAQLAGPPDLDFSKQGNPRITVRLQKPNLPVFFARIFGSSAATVAATATAEAYNPSYSQSKANPFIPSAPKCVKPFLVPNVDPASHQQFVDENTWAVTTGQAFLGKSIVLNADCKNGKGQKGCALQNDPPHAGEYVPMLTSSTHSYCPSNSAPGCGSSSTPSNFELSVECCDGTAFNFKQCGGKAANLATWDPTINPGGAPGPAQNALQCLIHTTASGPNSQQDSLDPSNFITSSGPPQISPGSFSWTRYNIPANSLMSASDSIITVPLFHVPASMTPPNTQVTIVGFLQLFVNYVGPGGPGSPADMNATIINVIGCGDLPTSGTSVSGGGVSPIPVRLVNN